MDQHRRAESSPTGKSLKTPQTHTPRAGIEDEIEGEIARVRAREEKRLLTMAEKAGYFDWRMPSKDLKSMFEAGLFLEPRKRSTLAKLTKRLRRLSTSRRSDDTKRKIILGGFVVAQCRHKPDLHVRLAEDITAYFGPTRNRDHLADFLTDPHATPLRDDPAPTGRKSDREDVSPEQTRARTHRQILLGTWLLARRTDNPVLAQLIADELAGFLNEEKNPRRNRALLADLLPDKVPTD